MLSCELRIVENNHQRLKICWISDAGASSEVERSDERYSTLSDVRSKATNTSHWPSKCLPYTYFWRLPLPQCFCTSAGCPLNLNCFWFIDPQLDLSFHILINNFTVKIWTRIKKYYSNPNSFSNITVICKKTVREYWIWSKNYD